MHLAEQRMLPLNATLVLRSFLFLPIIGKSCGGPGGNES